MKRSLRLALLFIILVLIGLVGMLVSDGPMADALFLACAAAPVAVGALSWWRARRVPGSPD